MVLRGERAKVDRWLLSEGSECRLSKDYISGVYI